MPFKDQILIGAILGVHGLKGAVRVKSFTEDPENLFVYAPMTDKTGQTVFKLSRLGVTKDQFIAKIEGVSDRTAAEALKGTKLYVAREALPPTAESEYYEADLIGLEARDEAGKPIGVVNALHNYGAGTFLEIKPAEGPSFMLPFKDSFVPLVDIDNGFLTALVPADWLKKEQEP
jgi:16S rRNA processing protein RimM